MVIERYTFYALVGITLSALVVLVTGGMHYLKSSLSSYEEIDKSQFPALEDLAILVRMEQKVESDFQLAVLTGQNSFIDNYNISLLTFENRLSQFKDDRVGLDLQLGALDRSELSKAEKQFLDTIVGSNPIQNEKRVEMRSMDPSVTALAVSFREKLFDVTREVITHRQHFLKNQKYEISQAINLSFLLSLVIVMSVSIAGWAYQSAVRKSKESELKALNSSRLASLGEMAGGIAHEINNPLAIISGYLDLSISGLEKGREQDISKAIVRLEKSQVALKRITEVIKALKTFSRDGSRDQKRTVSIADLVQESISLCSEHLANLHISVEKEIDDELSVLGNRTELSQVIINLIGNSIYAIKDQDYPWIKIIAKKVRNEIRLSIVDSGTGIDSEVASQILKPFYTTKPVGEGTGLGLSISYRIIKNHKGTLALDETSRNTKFDIVFKENVELQSHQESEKRIA